MRLHLAWVADGTPQAAALVAPAEVVGLAREALLPPPRTFGSERHNRAQAVEAETGEYRASAGTVSGITTMRMEAQVQGWRAAIAGPIGSGRTAVVELGHVVTYRNRAYYLRGLDPMSVDARRADLEDLLTGVRISVPLEDVVEGEPPDRKGRRRLEEA